YGDMDLHYLGPNGTFFDTGGFSSDGSDIFYENKTPDWGRNNTTQPDGTATDDASLDIDTLWGHGPENVTHNQPFQGTFKVIVTYYCSRAFDNFSGYSTHSSGPTNPVLKVFVNGVEAFSATKQLHQRDVWEVATVNVNAGATQITVT